MKVTVNLATRPFADIGPIVKRLRIAMAVFAVVSIGLGIGLHLLSSQAEKARARDHSLDGAIARVNGERRGYEDMMRQPDNATVLAQSNNLNRLFDEKNFSWTLAMEDLETVLPGGVQVTTLEPARDKTGRITLRLRVVGPRDRAVALVQNLEHSRHFLLPRIVGESSENNGGPNERLEPVSASNRVNFDVLADYNPAALNEKAHENKRPETTPKSRAESSLSAATPHHPAATRRAGPGLQRLPNSGASQPPSSPSVRGQHPLASPFPATPQTTRKPNPGEPK